MDKKRIKRIIAKEALIILGLACVLYLLVNFFLQNAPVVLPRYRLEFADGKAYTVTIMPEIPSYSNYRQFLKEAYNPPPKLVEKRVKEFIKLADIKPELKGSRYINSGGVHISQLYSRIMGTMFILKLVFAYFLLLLIRFMVWAIRALVH